MGRSWSERQKERIKSRITAKGRVLFAQQGLRKTSIEELTRAAGIAKSSFYVFFESKEQLYLELLAEEGPAAEARIRTAIAAAPSRREGLRAILRGAIQELESNALTRRILAYPEELELLVAAATPEQLEQSGRSALGLIVPYLRDGQGMGEIAAGDPVLYARALSAITLLTLHRAEIGEGYDEVLETVVDLLCRALAPAGSEAGG